MKNDDEDREDESTMKKKTTDRNATPEEWTSLIARVPPRVAAHLRSGRTAFVGLDGVRLHPPHGYALGEPVLVHKTTVTFAPHGAPN